MHKVAILGAGKIGQALGGILHGQGAVVAYWDLLPDLVAGQVELGEALFQADYVFICVPSLGVRSVVRKAKPFLRRGQVVVSLAKGLEQKTRLSMDAVLTDVVPPGIGIGVLGGPMLASEVRDFSYGVLGMKPGKKRTLLANMFAKSPLRIEVSSDIRGVALCGVLKNCYALGIGMLAGLGYRKNALGWFVARAIVEMRGLVSRLGGQQETVLGLAGLGDLIATGMSDESWNVATGAALIHGTTHVESEGSRSLRLVQNLLGQHVSRYPLLKALLLAYAKPQNAKTIFEALR